MGTTDPLQLTSLIEGVESAVARELGITNCRHRSALYGLWCFPETDIARTVLNVIAQNWRLGEADKQLGRSRENWRWSLRTQIGAHNRSPEVLLERAIAAACLRTGRRDWANQIPVSSGLILGASGRRRAIDLVQQRGDAHFELIELKVNSDTPLYAAIEALAYSSIWLLTREARQGSTSSILAATRLDVRVLAPSRHYEPFELEVLESSIDRSLKGLAPEHGVQMNRSPRG